MREAGGHREAGARSRWETPDPVGLDGQDDCNAISTFCAHLQ
jgi:hypothetical protein